MGAQRERRRDARSLWWVPMVVVAGATLGWLNGGRVNSASAIRPRGGAGDDDVVTPPLPEEEDGPPNADPQMDPLVNATTGEIIVFLP